LEEISIPAKWLHWVPEEEMQTMPAVCQMSWKLIGTVQNKEKLLIHLMAIKILL